jgi:hypothetical protein
MIVWPAGTSNITGNPIAPVGIGGFNSTGNLLVDSDFDFCAYNNGSPNIATTASYWTTYGGNNKFARYGSQNTGQNNWEVPAGAVLQYCYSQVMTLPPGTYTLSAYIDATTCSGGLPYISMFKPDISGPITTASGAVSVFQGAGSRGRVSGTFTLATATPCVFLMDSNGTSVSSSILDFSVPQLETGSVMTPYKSGPASTNTGTTAYPSLPSPVRGVVTPSPDSDGTYLGHGIVHNTHIVFGNTGTALDLDAIPDGRATYGRPILTRLNAGRPWIDFSEGIHSGKHLGNIADFGSRFAAVEANADHTGTYANQTAVVKGTVASDGTQQASTPNLLPNSDFALDSGATGLNVRPKFWGIYDNGSERTGSGFSTSTAGVGTNHYFIQWTTNTTTKGWYVGVTSLDGSANMVFRRNATYVFSAYFFASVAGIVMGIANNGGFASITPLAGFNTTLPANAWARVAWLITVGNTDTVSSGTGLYPYTASNPGVATTLYMTAPQLEEGSALSVWSGPNVGSPTNVDFGLNHSGKHLGNIADYGSRFAAIEANADHTGTYANQTPTYQANFDSSGNLKKSTTLNGQGSLLNVAGTPVQSYSSTTTSITLSIPATTYRFTDNVTTVSVPAYNPAAWTGLTANTTYYFNLYYDTASNTFGAAFYGTTPPTPAQQLADCYRDGRVPLFPYYAVATPISGTGGGAGGGTGHTPQCPADYQPIVTKERGPIRADALEVGMHTTGPLGWVRITGLNRKPAPIWRYALTDGTTTESWDVNDTHAVAGTLGWRMVRDLKPGDTVLGQEGVLAVTAAHFVEDGNYVAMEVEGHVYTLGKCLVHNPSTL